MRVSWRICGAGLPVVPLGLVLSSHQDRFTRLRSACLGASTRRGRSGRDAAYERSLGQGLARITPGIVGQTPCARADRAGYSLHPARRGRDADDKRRHGANDGRPAHLRFRLRPLSRITRPLDVARRLAWRSASPASASRSGRRERKAALIPPCGEPSPSPLASSTALGPSSPAPPRERLAPYGRSPPQ